MSGRCKLCNRLVQLRAGFCWDCVELEAVISDGEDMEGKIVAKTAMEKLEYIFSRIPVYMKDPDFIKEMGSFPT